MHFCSQKNYFLLITNCLQNNKAIAIFDLKFNYFIVSKALAKSTLNFLNNLTRQKPPPEVFCKKGALICSAKFTGKHLCQSLSPVPEACSFIKVETLAQVLICEFCLTSKNNFLKNTFVRLPLPRYMIFHNFLTKTC